MDFVGGNGGSGPAKARRIAENCAGASALLRSGIGSMASWRERLFPALLSLLDAILGVSMSTLLERLPIDREIKAALLGAPSRLRPLYELVLAHESANWAKCGEIANRFHIPEQKIAEAYLESVKWAREVAEST
jgi:EAL and modified HD-GYP domain-containing signal transduction protein